jgi:hypothetical protein
VGLLDALRLNRSLAESTTGVVPKILSPWVDHSALASVVWADLFDSDLLPMTRAEAMQVPSMARARHLIVGAAATCPLRAYRGTAQLDDLSQPAWMYRTDGQVSPWHRMAWTLDDHLFHGWSLWAADRGTSGQLLGADRVPYELWAFDSDGRTILVLDKPVSPRDVILIPGPHEGVLSFAARTLRAAGKLERAAARHASNPVPSVELRQTVDVELTTGERDELIAGWVAARSGETGAVGFTSYGIEAHPLGQVPEQLLVEGRNASAVDVARVSSIPAAMLDATSAGASLTYETTTGRNEQFLDYGVRLYLDAISARLSLDDCLPRGQRTVFDTSALTSLAPPAGAPATLD